MPTPAHETLIRELTRHPDLLGELVQRLLGVAPGEPLTVADSALRLADPIEVRPDLLLLGPSSWVMVEVQASADEAKARRWPVAAAVLLNQHQVMGDVVVITHSPAVAAWSLEVAVIGGRWGSELALRPRVLLIDEAAASALLDEGAPHLAFLAAWAMQDRHGAAAVHLVERALALTSALPAPWQAAQFQAILNVLSPTMFEIWRQRMQPLADVPDSPALKAFKEFLVAEGEARGEIKILLRLLQARGFSVSPERRDQILACRDLHQIEAWVDRVSSARTLEEVLG